MSCRRGASHLRHAVLISTARTRFRLYTDDTHVTEVEQTSAASDAHRFEDDERFVTSLEIDHPRFFFRERQVHRRGSVVGGGATTTLESIASPADAHVAGPTARAAGDLVGLGGEAIVHELAGALLHQGRIVPVGHPDCRVVLSVLPEAGEVLANEVADRGVVVGVAEPRGPSGTRRSSGCSSSRIPL